MPDEKWGERPAAFVVERKGFPGGVTSASLASRLSKWAISDRVTIVAALPKTSVGKIDKKALRGDAPA